jgi:phosphotransferase system enzyme I (PtsI)
LRKAIRDSDWAMLQQQGSKLLQARDRAGIERWLAKNK